jgi:hypothetical protein
MNILDEELASLTELDNLRREARQLRQAGKEALRNIQKNIQKEVPKWEASEDLIEAALLVKIQAHRHLGGEEHDAKPQNDDLIDRLLKIRLKEDLFIDELNEKNGPLTAAQVPVLAATRIMQSLVTTSKYAFTRASLLCYYRIVREIQSADSPNWTIGGAKAGKGGDPTAFITSECIRAILSFERTHRDTSLFFRQTFELYEELKKLQKLDDKQPASVQKWKETEIERVGLAWFTSTEVRLGEIALKLHERNTQGPINRAYLEEYLKNLPNDLKKNIEKARVEFVNALDELNAYREGEEQSVADPALSNSEQGKKERRRLDRSETAHRLAKSVVEQAIEAADKALELCEEDGEKTLQNLEKLSELFEEIAGRIHKVAEPAKRFVEAILNRELAAASSGTKMDWDARELVFAAAAYGAVTGWETSERLTQACILLSEAISQKGTFPPGRPFLLMSNGFVLHPIAFEVTRCFAQLLQRVNVPVNARLVLRLLHLFRLHKCEVEVKKTGSTRQCGWCFEDPLVPTKPSLWVTATAVMALNRIVRMLNAKINFEGFKYFSVKQPGKGLTGPELKQLIYPDYGLTQADRAAGVEPENSIAITLERMRAHILKINLPKSYKHPLYSSLFYGPPGTGKTTLLEALALSSNVPLVEISPSDIVVAGQELVESRARAVFEVLSMLSRVVITLDEFEPILYKREEAKAATSIFTFVTPAMLPKLKKLHEAAKQQSLVYCLVTNHRDKLDEAAIRKGRFDHHIGIYDMDPLSRAGVFLKRIYAKIDRLERAQYKRFEEVIRLLAAISIDEAVKEWFKVPEKDGESYAESPYAYILENSQGFKKGPNYRKALRAHNQRYQKSALAKVSDPVKRRLDELESAFKTKSLEMILRQLESLSLDGVDLPARGK